jgi:hypothetical protein
LLLPLVIPLFVVGLVMIIFSPVLDATGLKVVMVMTLFAVVLVTMMVVVSIFRQKASPELDYSVAMAMT